MAPELTQLEKIKSQNAELEDALRYAGTEPITPPGDSPLTLLLKGLSLPVNIASGVAMRAIPGENPEGFDPKKQSIMESLATAMERNYGAYDVIEKKAPEVDFLGAMGVSKENQNAKLPVGSALPDLNVPITSVKNAFKKAPEMASNIMNPTGWEGTWKEGLIPGAGTAKAASGVADFISSILPDKLGTSNLPEDISLRGVEEGTEKATRVVASLIAESEADPFRLLSYGGKPLGKIASTANQLDTDVTGQLIKHAAGRDLTKIGSDVYAQIRNKEGIKALMDSVPDAATKRQIYLQSRQGMPGMSQPGLKYKSVEAISDDAYKLLQDTNNKLNLPGLAEDNMDILRTSQFKGDVAADNMLKSARAVQENEQLQKVARSLFTDPKQVTLKESTIRDQVLLGQDFDVKDLFSNQTLRFGGHAIPGASDVKEFMNGSMYGISSKLSEGLTKARLVTEDIPVLSKITAGMDELRKFAPKSLSLVSRRVMSGGGDPLASDNMLRMLKENEAARMAVDVDAFSRSNRIFKDFSEEEITRASNSFDNARIRIRMMKAKNPNLPMPKESEMAIREIEKDFPRDAAILRKVEAEQQSILQRERAAGIEIGEIDSYMNRQYLLVPGVRDERSAISRTSALGKTPSPFVTKGELGGHNLERSFELVDDAIARGYHANKDIRTLYAQRLASSNVALANRKMMENMQFNFGLDPATRERVALEMKAGLTDNVSKVSSTLANARRQANVYGVKVTDADIMNAVPTQAPLPIRNRLPSASGMEYSPPLGQLPPGVQHVYENVNPAWGLPRTLNGDEITIEHYDELARVHKTLQETGDYLEPALGQGLSGKEDFEKLVEKNKFDFSPEERQVYAELSPNFVDATEKLRAFGRQGEMLTDRAGVEALPDELQKAMKGLDITPGTKEWLSGDLPTPIIDALKDSFETKTYMSKFVEGMEEGQMKDAIVALRNGFNNYTDAMRFGSTIPMASYHSRNLSSGQVGSAVQATGTIAENINPVRLMKMHQIIKGKADVITDVGERIPHQQLRKELNQEGIMVSAADFAEMTASQADLMNMAGKFVGKDTSAYKKLGKAASFQEAVENFGRGPTYISLRMKGYSPSDAAYTTKKAFIDYKTGKTNFEKSIASNMFFFYAYARGNASNTLVNILTKPSAVSAQSTYIRAVGNAMQDDDSPAQPFDFTRDFATIAPQGGYSQYLGLGKEGDTSKVLTNVGTPIEEGMKLIAPFNLPSELSVNAIMDTAKRAAGQMTKAQISMMTPLLKATLEKATNTSTYFGTNLDNPGLNQSPTKEALLSQLMGNGPVEDPTVYEDSQLVQTARQFMPPVSSVYAKLNQFAKADNLGDGLTKFLLALSPQTVDIERTGAYTRRKDLSQQLMSQFGIDLGNKTTDTIEEEIAQRQAGKNPVKERKKQQEMEALLKLVDPAELKAMKKRERSLKKELESYGIK